MAVSVLSKFFVTVVEARDLVDSDWFGKSDPLLKLTHGSQHFQTSVKNNTLSPVWNERFTFVKEATSSTVTLNMFDKDIFGTDPLGTGTLFLDNTILNELRLSTSVERWVSLTLRNGPAGRVRLQLSGEFSGTGYGSPVIHQSTIITQPSPTHTPSPSYVPSWTPSSSFLPGAFLNPQPVGVHNFRKARWHSVTWEVANTAWTSEGYSKCMTHETASTDKNEWKLMLAPWDTVITSLQGEVVYDIKGSQIILSVGDELTIPAHMVYHLKVHGHQSAILCWAYRGDLEGHRVPVQTTTGVAVRSTVEARNESQARYLDGQDGKIDGKYFGDTIHAKGSVAYGQKGTWEASDAGMARVVDSLDRRADGGYAGSRIVVSRDGYVDGKI